DEPGRALRWYHRAAEQALEANDLAAAVERADQGVACGATGHDLGALRLVQAEAHVWRGELALAEERSVEATALLEHGSAAWSRAVAQAPSPAGKLGRYEGVEVWVREAGKVAVAQESRSAQVICLCHSASFLIFGGRYAAADAVIEQLRRDVPNPAALAPPV